MIYFNENEQETESVEQPDKGNHFSIVTLASVYTNYHFQITEKEEYEKAVLDVISKRRQGTKTCKDVLEKTLSLEKRAVVCESTFISTI